MKRIYSLWPLAVILGALVVFFWPNLTWPAVNITPTVGTNDFTDLNYPFRHFLIESLKRGEIPLWSSRISAGYPILAEGQIAALYPLNLLAAFLPLMASVNFTILSTYLLIALLTYFYLREIKLGRPAATFGAINMALSGFAVAQLLHWGMIVTLAFLLGEMLFLEKMVKTGKTLYALILGLFLGFQFLGGHPQMIFYSLIFLGLYFLFLNLLVRTNLLKNLILFVLFILLGLGIGAAQNLPQYEFTQNSTRVKGLSLEAITRFNFPIKDLSTFVFPHASYDDSQTVAAFQQNGWPQDERYAYVGILPLVLALLAIFTLWKRKSRVIFYIFIFAFSLLLSFGGETLLGIVLTKPPFNLFRLPLRFLMLADLSLVVLAAFGVERVLGKLVKLGKLGRLGLWGLGVLAALVALTFLDLWYFGSKLHPAVPARDWYQTPEVAKFLKENLKDQERATTEYYYYPTLKIFMTQRHLWDESKTLINLRNLIPVFNNLLDGIPMAVGAANSGGLKIQRYNDLEMETFFNGVEYSSSGKVSLSDGYLFLNRLSGVRYVIFSQELPQGLGLSKVFQTDFKNGQDNVYVYEFFDYYLRAFMVPQAQVEEPEKIKEHLLKVDFDPKQTVFLEEKTDWGAKGAIASSVQFISYKDQEVKIKVQVSNDGFLFLSDTYYPGWKAYVDGQEKKIYLANYAFRAVEVPKGDHEVIFKYEPQSFWWGIRISLGTGMVIVLGIAALGAREVWRKRR